MQSKLLYAAGQVNRIKNRRIHLDKLAQARNNIMEVFKGVEAGVLIFQIFGQIVFGENQVGLLRAMAIGMAVADKNRSFVGGGQLLDASAFAVRADWTNIFIIINELRVNAAVFDKCRRGVNFQVFQPVLF